jgi:hypothetical protein
MRALRFLLVACSGLLTRIGHRHVLRLSHNPATETRYASIANRLAAWSIFGLRLTLMPNALAPWPEAAR